MSAHNGLRPPIDISTVESRLLTGEYTQLDDFCADFELALKMAVVNILSVCLLLLVDYVYHVSGPLR